MPRGERPLCSHWIPASAPFPLVRVTRVTRTRYIAPMMWGIVVERPSACPLVPVAPGHLSLRRCLLFACPARLPMCVPSSALACAARPLQGHQLSWHHPWGTALLLLCPSNRGGGPIPSRALPQTMFLVYLSVWYGFIWDYRVPAAALRPVPARPRPRRNQSRRHCREYAQVFLNISNGTGNAHTFCYGLVVPGSEGGRWPRPSVSRA